MLTDSESRVAEDVSPTVLQGADDPSAVASVKCSSPSSVTICDSPPPATFHSLAVKQKAVYQPTLKHRRWMEEQREIVPPGETKSISDIESNLPPQCGAGASYVNYIEQLEQVQQRLDGFYNGDNMRFKKHKWDARRARDTKYITIANRLLSIVGGSIGRKRAEDDNVVIAVGLGQFSTKQGLFHCMSLSCRISFRG